MLGGLLGEDEGQDGDYVGDIGERVEYYEEWFKDIRLLILVADPTHREILIVWVSIVHIS